MMNAKTTIFILKCRVIGVLSESESVCLQPKYLLNYIYSPFRFSKNNHLGVCMAEEVYMPLGVKARRI
jgi:hypothetical protein